MKKIILLGAILCISFYVKSQHISNKETLDILAESLDYNMSNNEVKNPNMIYPGNKLTFLLKNGDTLSFPIKRGDNMWTLAKKAKRHNSNNPNNPIINPSHRDTTVVLNKTTEKETIKEIPSNELSLKSEIFMMLVILLLGMMLVVNIRKKRE